MRGTLRVVSLVDRPTYEALSWFWGDANVTSTIVLNGRKTEVPRNLVEALLQFRDVQHARDLWVDALSINQNDHQEREAQIAMMGDIYRNATRTVVWLGPVTPPTDRKMFETLNSLSHGTSLRQIVLEDLGVCKAHESYNDVELQARIRDHEGKGAGLLEELSSFFKLTWWRRLWVLQEVAVASTVDLYWGRQTMNFRQMVSAIDLLLIEIRTQTRSLIPLFDWEDFEQFSNYVLRQSLGSARYVQIFYKELRAIAETLSIRELCFKFIELLAATRPRNATDPRDKIYGLLGLLPTTLVQQFPPSYTVATHVVFRETAYRLLDLTRSYMLFNCVREGYDFSPGWAPRWTYDYQQLQNFRLRTEQELQFQACGTSSWDLTRINDTVLQVSGFRLDVVATNFVANFDLTDALSLYQWLQICLRKMCPGLPRNLRGVTTNAEAVRSAKLTKYITGVGVLEALCKTIFHDCGPSSTGGRVERLSESDYLTFISWFMSADELSMQRDYETGAMVAAEQMTFKHVHEPSMCEFARGATSGRAFVTTKLGYVGLVDYEDGRIEDEIWILAGGSHPIVLRPVEDQNDHYYVICETYLHGVMDGEATRGSSPVLPLHEDATTVQDDLREGRKSWPVPEFKPIYLV